MLNRHSQGTKIMKKSTFLYILYITLIATLSANNVQSQLDHANEFFMNRQHHGNLPQSIQLLEAIDQSTLNQEESYTLNTQLAHYYLEYRLYENLSKDERLHNLEKGLSFSQHALEINPNGVKALYWHSALLGKIGEFRGILESLSSIGPIHDNMQAILEQDPSFSRAHFVLAKLYRKAPPFISIGNTKKARHHILEALKLDKTSPLYRLEYAHLLIKLEQNEQAISVLNKLLQTKDRPQDFKPTTTHLKQEAAILLEQLSDHQ